MPITMRVCAVLAALLSAVPALAQTATFTYDMTTIAPQWDSDYGTKDAKLSTADEAASYYDLGFTLDYFGQPFTSFWVETNGALMTSPMGWNPWNSAEQLRVLTRVAPLWDDWTMAVGTAETGVWVKQDLASSPQRFVVTWAGRPYRDPTGLATFQAVLYSDGRIQFNYLPYVQGSVTPTSTIGISIADPATAWAWDVGAITTAVSYVFTPHRDTTAPTTVHALSGSEGSAGWYRSDVTLTLSASDDEGVASTEYSVDGVTWYAYGAPLVFSAEGAYSVQYRSTDLAGNVESPPGSATFEIDRTPPAVTIAAPAEGAVYPLCSALVADWTATDAALASADGTLPSGSPVDTTVAGTYAFTVTATDLAGNVTAATASYAIAAKNRGQRCK